MDKSRWEVDHGDTVFRDSLDQLRWVIVICMDSLDSDSANVVHCNQTIIIFPDCSAWSAKGTSTRVLNSRFAVNMHA